MPKELSRKVFVEELLRGKGIKAICKEYGYKSPSVFYNWKKKYPDFKEQAEKILAGPLHAERIRASQAPKTGLDEKTWRDRYFAEYQINRDRVAAADSAGKTISFIMNACDPSHPDFDEEFAERNKDEMLREAVQVEDDLRRKAVIENSVQMQKWLLPYLPGVGDKYKKGYENRLVKKEETNILLFTNSGIQKQVKLLNDIFGEDHIVDVTN